MVHVTSRTPKRVSVWWSGALNIAPWRENNTHRQPRLPRTLICCREEFGQDPNDGSEYMPHASLVYGDLPMPTRDAIRQEAEPGLLSDHLVLDSLEVWCTQGVVTKWERLATFAIE